MFPLPINGGSVACALLVLMMKAILLVPLDSPRLVSQNCSQLRQYLSAKSEKDRITEKSIWIFFTQDSLTYSAYPLEEMSNML